MYEIYIAKKGDTLPDIAKKYNVDLQELYKINNFSPLQLINEGDKIVLPIEKKDSFNYYEIKKGDTLNNIAKRFKISPIDLALVNGLNLNDYIYDGQIILIPRDGYLFTITEQGDTLYNIAKRLNTNINEVLSQNPDIFVLPEQLITYKFEK